MDRDRVRYVYGLDLISRIEDTTPTPTSTFYLYDGLGSTSAVTAASGNSTDTYDYDVFGATRSETGTSDQPFRFTGEYQDVDVGKDRYYLRARLYDPALGDAYNQIIIQQQIGPEVARFVQQERSNADIVLVEE